MVGEFMKKLFLVLPLLILAVACDSPQRTRLGKSAATGDSLNQPNNGSPTNPWGSGGTTGSSNGSNTPKPPGFENCDLSAKYYAAGINYIGLCQSTQDETSIAVFTTVADTAKTCLIPTYKDSTGSSTYLGQPQCFLPEANKVTMGKLYKTRTGFTGNPITGVMVMKEASLGAYFTCMDAYVSFPRSMCPKGAQTNQYCYNLYQQCPAGARTSAYCDQIARTDMNTKCSNFKTDHSYIDICVKSSACGSN